MTKDQIKFLVFNNILFVVALVGAIFEQPGIYATFFAISLAMQISHVKKENCN